MEGTALLKIANCLENETIWYECFNKLIVREEEESHASKNPDAHSGFMRSRWCHVPDHGLDLATPTPDY